MPIHHKIEKVRAYLVDGVLSDMEKAQAVGAELSAILLGLAAVDYIASFYVGRQSKRVEYVAFMRRYFHSKYQPFLEDVYDQLRAGLMHNLVATNPWKPRAHSFAIQNVSQRHLETNSEGKLYSASGTSASIYFEHGKCIHTISS